MYPNPKTATLLIILYIIHFFIARWITIKLIQHGFIRRDSQEFEKAVLFWFAPIVGALGLWFLFLINKFLLWCKWFNVWIRLLHYIPERISISYNEKEILQRAEMIKKMERGQLKILTKKQKKK